MCTKVQKKLGKVGMGRERVLRCLTPPSSHVGAFCVCTDIVYETAGCWFFSPSYKVALYSSSVCSKEEGGRGESGVPYVRSSRGPPPKTKPMSKLSRRSTLSSADRIRTNGGRKGQMDGGKRRRREEEGVFGPRGKKKCGGGGAPSGMGGGEEEDSLGQS